MKQKEAAGGYRSRCPQKGPVERERRGEWSGVVRGGRGGRTEGRKEGVRGGGNLTTPSQVVGNDLQLF